jgi:cytochrome P450
MSDDMPLPDIPLYSGATELETLRDVDAVFRDREFTMQTHIPSRDSYQFVGGTLLSIDGLEHSNTRRLHGPLFRKDALEHYETEIILASIDTCLAGLRERRGPAGIVHADLVQVCREMLCDMAARLIGLGDLADPNRRRRFMRLSELLAQGISISWVNTPDRDERLAESLAAKQEFWSEWVEPKLKELRQEHAREATSGEDALDLLTLLVSQDLADETIVRNCLMYAAGSINTTTQGVVNTVIELQRWFTAHPDRWGDRRNHAFLHAAAGEALRLHPPIPAVLRKAGHEKHLPSGLQLAEEEVVALHLTKANRQEELFGACPHAMDPTRQPVDDVKPYGTSFGGGRHVCIGRTLALPSRADGDTTAGSMVRMLDALYAAGMRPDPDAEPPQPINDREDYDRYPVVFTEL